jgi:hypothetical protein
MHVSAARLAANKLNAARSTGPKTEEGKAISRGNSLKHGLTGDGIVVPDADRDEIDLRAKALEADLKPRSTAGLILIAQMATLSVRAERAVEQESAAISRNVRHAADDFDEERIARANELFESLAEDPRNNLRKLKKRPEGVERLIEEWEDLRNDLAIDPQADWTPAHLERAARLTGLKPQHARSSRLGALSRGVWGDFAPLGEADGGGLVDEARRRWAKGQLFERIDAEIAALEAHYETLDFETIELDRLEAPQRALFDASKPAILARRYESEASRGFYKALKEFRIVEAELEAKAESIPTPSELPRAEARMGSSREPAPPPGRDPSRLVPEAPIAHDPVVLGANGQTLRYTPAVQSTE